MGDSRKHPYLYHFDIYHGILRTREGSLNWKSKGTEGTLLEFLSHRFFFRGERGEYECTSKLMTQLMTMERKIQDEHRLFMHMFTFIYRRKPIKSGGKMAGGGRGGVVKMFMPPVVRCGYFLEISPNDYLVTRISLTLSSNDFPHSSYSFWSRMVFGCW